MATRFSDDVLAELDEIAREIHPARAEVVGRAVAIYFAQFADYQIALHRLHDADDPVITSQEMWSDLGWDTPEPQE